MMSHSNRKQRSTYRCFVEAGIMDIDTAFVETKKQSRLCIGSGACLERVEALYDSLLKGVVKVEDVSFCKASQHRSAAEVLTVVCEVLGIEQAEL